MVQYGRKIKYFREMLGMSQAKLGELVGQKQQVICWWENNVRTPDAVKLAILADALGVKMDDLREAS